MAILGIGTDIAEVGRFRIERLSHRFLAAVFTDAERAYCLAKSRPEQHLAARFAAKEAAAKALCAAGFRFISVCQIEVVRSGPASPPTLALHPGRHGEPPPALPDAARFHVSLSHSDHAAIAMVVLESDAWRA